MQPHTVSDLLGLRLVNQLCLWPQMLQGNVIPRTSEIACRVEQLTIQASCAFFSSMILRLPVQNFALTSNSIQNS